MSKNACPITSRWSYYLLAVLFSLIGLLSSAFSHPVLASTYTFDSQDSWDTGVLNNLQNFDKDGTLQLSEDGIWTGSSIRNTHYSLAEGATVASDGHFVYLFSQYTNFFSRYVPDTDRWEVLAQTPFSPGPGSSMTYLDGYIYAVFGLYHKKYARYDVSLNTWEVLAETPEYLHQGAVIGTDGSDIYLLRGTGQNEFWKYDDVADEWLVLAGYPLTVGRGASLTYYDGGFYALRGNAQRHFYRYDIATNIWTALAIAPNTLASDRQVALAGDKIYVPRGSGVRNVYVYDIGTGLWSDTILSPTVNNFVGMVYVADEAKIYHFSGNSTTAYGSSAMAMGQLAWKFDPSQGTYESFELLPNTPTYGSDLIYDNGDLYYLIGGNRAAFYKYTLASNTWTTLANMPANTGSYDIKGTLVDRGGVKRIYFQRGSTSGTGLFHAYNINTGLWETPSENTVYFHHGAASAYPGSGDYLYLSLGNTRRTIVRYDMQNDVWDDAAIADLPVNYQVYYGSRMFSYDGDIYITTSYDSFAEILRYDWDTSTWMKETDLPATSYPGSDFVVSGSKLYYQIGYYRLEVWVYDLVAKTWSRIRDLQGDGAYNYGPYDGGSLEAGPDGMLFSTWGRTRGYMQVYYNNGDRFAASGSFTSKTLDMGYVSAWSSFELDQTVPSDSSLNLRTRSSSDGRTWSAWEAVVGNVPVSPVNRYLQVKVELNASTNQLQSPSLESLSINYVGDTEPPVAPTGISAKSRRVGGVVINSGDSNTHARPYFTWSGASDAETTVTGYYVYFGSNAAAVPSEDGVLSINAQYEVNEPLTLGTYYLRIQAKDQAEHLSTVFPAFTYLYKGPGTSNQQFFADEDFAIGSLENSNLDSDVLRLDSSQGFWLEDYVEYMPTNMALGDSTGSVYLEESRELFVFEASNGVDFAKYNLDTKTWTSLAPLPSGARYGSFLVKGPDGYLFAAKGNSTNIMWRYDIAANQWSDPDAMDAPSMLYRGHGTADGEQFAYVFKGNGTDSFWRYDMINDSWASLASAVFYLSNAVHYGSYLEMVGADSVYAIQGYARTGFSKYDIGGDGWEVLPTLPHVPTTGAFLKYYAPENFVIYYPGGYQFMYKFDLETQEWSSLAQPPVNMGGGADAEVIGDEMYVWRGSSGYAYIYNIKTDSWSYPRQGLFTDVFYGNNYVTNSYGADIVKGDGDLFYMNWGNLSSQFIAYNPKTDEVFQLADLPVAAYLGSDFVYDEDDNKIYAVFGDSSTGFFVYDIPTNRWSRIESDSLAYAPSYGSTLAYDGERYIYWQRGSDTRFYRYDKQGTAGARWELLRAIPGAVSYGAELVYKNGYLYTLRGATYNPAPLYRYNPADNTWATMANFPNISGFDSFMLANSDPGSLYACSAHNNVTRGCYSYSIANNEWTSAGEAPARLYRGAAAASDGAGRTYMMAGNGTAYVRDSLYTYVEQTADTAFVEEGEYSSAVYDLGNVYDYARLKVEETIPNNTSIEYQTRSSSDNSTWSGWSEVSNRNVDDNYSYYKINSPAARYLQLKIELATEDKIYSPSVESYEIEYYQDLIKPSNPSDEGLSIHDSEELALPLTTETWYPYAQPYFDWPEPETDNGASDGEAGAGVYGYYVYFGTENDAIPEEEGELQMSSYYQPDAGDLLAGEQYYLRIQTVDKAENVSEATWAPFTYYFDDSAADFPANLISDPSGYSVSDSYTFSWNAIDNGDGDTISYCFKLESISGEETCTLATSVEGIAPYQSGTNRFYLRSKDRAGNYSAYTNVNYYHSGEAPSPPQNLQVNNRTSTTNDFTFTWSQPEFFYGSAEGLRYYYSVNALPTASSVTLSTSNSTLFAGPYATLPGENTLYMVTKDEAGKIDYDLYTSIKFEANTTAPGIPINVDIADVSVKATANWRLALSWEEPTEIGAGIANYKVWRSIDGENFSEIVKTSGTSHVDTRLIQQDYYYKVQACDSTNNCGVESSVVTLFPDGKFVEPAALLAEPATSMITSKMATISWATDRTCDSKIAYGKSSGAYNDLEAYNSMHVTDHTLTLIDLEPGTTYYYIAKWTDEDGNTGISEEATFATDPPPTVMEVVVDNVSINSATLNFTTVGASAVAIYYGTDTTFGGMEAMATSTTQSSYTLLLEGLIDDTLYYYKVNALDADGNQYEGTILDFKTLPAPKLADVTVQQIRGTAQPTVLVTWKSNTQVSSIVTYYPTATPALASDEINVELKSGLHRMLLKNLVPNMPYSLIVKGIDKVGNEALSEVLNFTTDSDNRPPAITGVKVDGSINNALGSDEVTAQLVVTWNTDEMSTSQVEFGEGTGTVYAQKTQMDSNMTFNHTVLVSGLTPSKVYHLRVLSMDEAGNEGRSVDIVKVTPKASDSALDLVVNNLSQVFGFLGNR